jgi:GxxExxY protein
MVVSSINMGLAATVLELNTRSSCVVFNGKGPPKSRKLGCFKVAGRENRTGRADSRRVTAEQNHSPGIFSHERTQKSTKNRQLSQAFASLAFSYGSIRAPETAMKTINELCDIVRETSYAIHLYHSHGHVEKVYENALVHRLRKAGLEIKQQPPIQVVDEDQTVIGEFNADLLVEGRLIVELKAARALADEHVAQLLGYLRSTRIETGLLINFGAYKFAIKKYLMTPPPNHNPGL